MTFRVKRDRIEVDADLLPRGFTIAVCGKIKYGEFSDSFAMCIDRDVKEDDLRAAYGPATSEIDDCIFDRKTDSAVRISGSEYRRLRFCHECGSYTFSVRGALTVESLIHVYEMRFRTRYKPINKSNAFPTAHTGWMTWYSIGFGANEERVLKNAEFQRKFLYDYGANTVWIDWEWYHTSFDYTDAPKNMSFFEPDPAKYPNGMKKIANEIKQMGMIPVLWVAPTVEPYYSELCNEFKDCICTDHQTWCGKYFFDVTNERVIEELIPRAFGKVKEWGFEAVKWDCLPNTLQNADAYHEVLRHPELTSTEAMRRLCQKARDVVGDNFYMMSCAGGNDREVLALSDVFDTARIGNDIFAWVDFIGDFVERILKFYSLHNVCFYCDPDNVVIRPEYSDFEQARSRVSPLALLGLPVTFGDELTELSEDRIEMLRRALPSLDIHPMDVREQAHDGKRFFVSLAVELPFESYNVFDILNMQEDREIFSINIPGELHLPEGEYLVFDFWHKKLLAVTRDNVLLDLLPNQSAVCSVRRVSGVPQVASTSRHLTQGAVDLETVVWDDSTLTLSGVSNVVKGDDYKIYVYIPQEYIPIDDIPHDGQIATLSPDTEKNDRVCWSIRFKKK